MERDEELSAAAAYLEHTAPGVSLSAYMTAAVDKLIESAKAYSRSEVAGVDTAAVENLRQARQTVLAPFNVAGR